MINKTCAELLIEAYRNGQRSGGSIDWEDVDLAYQAALEEVRKPRHWITGLQAFRVYTAAHRGGVEMSYQFKTELENAGIEIIMEPGIDWRTGKPLTP